MPAMRSASKLVTVRQAADSCDVPVEWLKQEALAARVPCLKVGRRLWFSVPALKRSLVKRAEEPVCRVRRGQPLPGHPQAAQINLGGLCGD